MKYLRVPAIIATLAVLVPAAATASGFGYYEHGAKATAMAGAFVARADDASAIYYNPAGLAFLDEKVNLYGAFHPVQPNSTATVFGVSTDTQTDLLPPFSSFAAVSITDSIKAGIGVFIPYGLEVEWPKNWIGSAISQRSYMSTYYIRPSLAFKLNENAAVGVGVDIVWSKLSLMQQRDFGISPLLPAGRVDAEVEGTGTGVGFTVGGLFKVNDRVQIGVKYQHEVEVDYDDGEATFRYTPSGHPFVDGVANTLFTNQGVSTTITMPSEFVVGVLFQASENLSFEVDYQYTTWDVFEVLQVSFDNPLLSFEDTGNWENSSMIRIGAEYWVAREWAVRGGYIFDQGAVPDETLKPLLPDADRNEFTFGLGFDSQEACCWGNWTADFAFQYVKQDTRTSAFAPFPAKYESDAIIVGFGVGVSF